MSEIPGDLKFLESHEWVRVDGEEAEVGISDHAQGMLGDLVYVELPDEGDTIEKGDAVAVVESVKAASDVYAPLSGEVVAINEDLADSPEKVNDDPYGDGWLFRIAISDPEELDELLDADDYGETLDDD